MALCQLIAKKLIKDKYIALKLIAKLTYGMSRYKNQSRLLLRFKYSWIISKSITSAAIQGEFSKHSSKSYFQANLVELSSRILTQGFSTRLE